MQKNRGSGHNINIGGVKGNIYLSDDYENKYSKVVAKKFMDKIIKFDKKYDNYKDIYGFIGFFFHILIVVFIVMTVGEFFDENEDLNAIFGIYVFLGLWGWPILSIFLFYDYPKTMFKKITSEKKLGLNELKEIVVYSYEYEAKNKKKYDKLIDKIKNYIFELENRTKI